MKNLIFLPPTSYFLLLTTYLLFLNQLLPFPYQLVTFQLTSTPPADKKKPPFPKAFYFSWRWTGYCLIFSIHCCIQTFVYVLQVHTGGRVWGNCYGCFDFGNQGFYMRFYYRALHFIRHSDRLKRPISKLKHPI